MDEPLDLVVIGAGVMGQFTAYEAAKATRRVALVERSWIGNPATASFGRTRSYRRDYLDPAYVRLADEAIRLWEAFEADTSCRALVRCGCLNIASADVTPDLERSYARAADAVMARAGIPTRAFDAAAVKERYPYLRADVAVLDEVAGVVDVGSVTSALRAALDHAGVQILEGTEPTAIRADGELLWVATPAGELVTRQLVVTAGHGTNDVLGLLPGCELRVPLERDRPQEAKYYTPPATEQARWTAPAMPVMAYLDTGIYLHPMVEGLVDAVKIGYYNPPDVPRGRTDVDSVAAFVARCVPGLAGAAVRDVTDVDGCDYDLVDDDEFVLGGVPGWTNVHVGVGWRGTGYKFAPWVGRVLAQLAIRGGTVYDISRFDPARFVSDTRATFLQEKGRPQ
ncbi:MAG TPA: FAD-dependent oxidoreductase [Acidimicrobiales bacterium]|nr:FAD-dependent oxidoreductase [Acidimicrobiales bacterium]